MANGHIEIHDPLKSQNGIASSKSPTQNSTSDSESTEDMVEFRILMAYAKRRRHKGPAESSGLDNTSTPNGSGINTNGTSSPQTEGIAAEKKKKKKKIWKCLGLTCLKPQTKEDNESPSEAEEDTDVATFRNLASEKQEDETEDIATRLTEISDEIPFVHPELEKDTPGDDVERVIGLLLRDAGDQLNETELKDTNILADLLRDYSVFEKVINVFLARMGLNASNPETPGPKASPKTQIAVTCEVTSRLSVLDTLPMNRLLGHGATYLKTHYSSWIEEQGGYEKAFYSEDDEDEVH